jgi:hypothetical protein
MINFSYYLHEKAEESRHNESIAYLVAIMGSVFLVGGIIQTLITVQRPQWFLIFPYQLGTSPYDYLGLGFTLMGVMLFLAGIFLGVHYGAQRVWYTNSLKDAYRFEEEKLRAKGKGKGKVLDFPVQRATENPEPQVTAEETPPQVAPDAQQI